ncbi:hypothetical protein GJ744_012217 [Endocarpon pusillum]|uniref:Protein kinase domain-containing protein n=1 Tax=Endocarpon pusillum TaxID=364733 RepID=A0A8H7AC62_9EURO|nr:hypothetical protein GJ744_012217 [Endocarpon pusillum]
MTDSQTWWTDERVQSTVTPEYVLKQFRLEEQNLLKRSIIFGDGVTNHTYLGCILERATRLFLILTHLGVPGLIFRLVDESYDDKDLPIAAEAVRNLRLSSGSDKSLDRRFYQAQFKYVARDVRKGHHIHFLDEETVPVRLVGSASGISRAGKDGIEKVHIGSGDVKIYGRKRIILEEPHTHLTEADVLSEIAFAKTLAHEHVLSLYGSYSHGNSLFVLLTPSIEYTLNSFVDSPPKHFESLPKLQRRETVLNWPHCLANGLAWLHSNRAHHGAIRPSNIIIDSAYHICLGQVDGLPVTHSNVRVSDIESYQYAAPERWKRAATMQTKTPAMLTMHSGGRTARKQNTSRHSASSSANDSHERRPSLTSPASSGFPIDTSKPTSTAYPLIPTSKGNNPRGQGRSLDKSDYASSILSSSSSETRQDRSNSMRVPTNQVDHQLRPRLPTSFSTARSHVSSHGADGGQNVNTATARSVTVAPSEIRSALIQTWQSAQFDPFAADIFSLGATILEVITFLCKRGSGAFSRHRSAKNRTAGRGGGVADASFHANLGQVFSWTVTLEQDAKKKASKEDGKIFSAVGPIMDIARECLARSADKRPDASLLETTLEGCIQQVTSSGTTHCSLQSHVDTPGKSRLAARAPLKHSVTLTPMQEKELGLSRTLEETNSSLASFNFDEYSLGKESMYKADSEADRESFERRRYSVIFPDDEIIDLQSIADRPDRIQNGTDISGWSHMHTDPRASYISSDSDKQSDLAPEPQQIDSFFKPASRPPSLPAKDLFVPQLGKALSQHSLTHARTSTPARKYATADLGRPGQTGSTSASAGPRGVIPNRDIARSTTSGSSTDSSHVRNSILSSTDRSRGRLSVSTLASNSSTIRLEWQQRDVSPVSVGDGNRTPNASACASEHAASEDEEVNDGTDEQTTASSRRGELSNAEKMYRNLQRSRMSLSKTGGESKGKKKTESSAGAKRAWLQSRYSLLGGKT